MGGADHHLHVTIDSARCVPCRPVCSCVWGEMHMANCFTASVLLCCLFFCPACCTVGNLDVETFPNGSFSISVGGKHWFRSGSLGVRDQGQWWSTSGGTLELTVYTMSTGINMIGRFTEYLYEWKTTSDSSDLHFLTSIDVYDEVPVVGFSLVLLDDATNTNIGQFTYNQTLSTFPSFVIEDGPVERGYVTWSGNSEYELGVQYHKEVPKVVRDAHSILYHHSFI